ncbi:MAG: hypothetical protein QNI89_06920 [Desulfobacterales bacterium]|nr:hypothetical protein [Desulfobacterales bacterium]MDJ0854791.1 hypothetical protein [Desulfobacterales bacterium]MDJ0887010.1 hypothetical protein [Desulfobacterales bacterium]
MRNHYILKRQVYKAVRPNRPNVGTYTISTAESNRADIRQIIRGPRLQTKLTIGAPNGIYEQEADRVADEVMRMPEPKVQKAPT